MDFQLSEEQKAIKDTVRTFVAKECPRELVREYDEHDSYPEGPFNRLAELGFCGLVIPEQHGGAGSDLISALIVAEEVSTVYPALAALYVGPTLCGGRNISTLGSETQKSAHLPYLAQGLRSFTYGLSEPHISQIDPDAVATVAERVDGELRLSGTKAFVRLADRSDFGLILCSTDISRGERGLSVLIVDLKSRGVEVERTPTVGYRGSGLHKVVFDNVTVASVNVLGGPEWLNRGLDQMARIKETNSLEVAACSVGIAQGACDYAADYARERVQFGKPIAEFGAVHNMLADIAIDLQAARLLTYWAGWSADRGGPCLEQATMARLFAVEAARNASLQCLQILGGYGYAMEYDAQLYVRDSLVLLGGCETPEILKSSLGRNIGLAGKTA